MPNLDHQLDALSRDLQALDDVEAQRELDAVEARIAADQERAARLRLILHVKQTWTSEVTVATPSGKTIVVNPQNGRKPKTRDAILAYLGDQDEWASASDVRQHLKTLGIDISGEAVRQALRRLRDEDLLIAEKISGVSYYKTAADIGPYRLTLDSTQE